jgi:hypothetical protein
VKYVPAWFPGATFKRIAAENRKFAREAFEKPYMYVRQQMVTLSFLINKAGALKEAVGGRYSAKELGCFIPRRARWGDYEGGRGVYRIYYGGPLVSRFRSQRPYPVYNHECFLQTAERVWTQ